MLEILGLTTTCSWFGFFFNFLPMSMFYLKLVPTFAIPVINPNTMPPYDQSLSLDTSVINHMCLLLSGNRENLSKIRGREYMCYCVETDEETKKFTEKTFKLVLSLKKANDPLSKALSKTFTDISTYLQTEFNKQEQIIKFLNGGARLNPFAYNSPVSSFTIKNYSLPPDQFYIKYYVFIMNHLLEKFKSDFEKLKIFNIPMLFKNEFEFINCIGRHTYAHGEFKNISDVIKLVNDRVMVVANSMVVLSS